MRGTIQKRGPDSWRIRIDLEHVAGKRQRRSVTVRGTYKDAQKELTRLLSAADAGTLVDPTTATVGDYLTQWLDNALNLSPKTHERYRELAARQIMPHLGMVKLQKLKPEHLETWHAALLKTGLSARTVGHAHRVLGTALTRAVENGTISRNVAAIRRPPKVESQEIGILTPAQVTAVLEALESHPLHPIASLALATGMRRGELLALQWSDVDLAGGKLKVERSVEETKTGLRIKPPKTKLSRRTVTLPPEAIAMLREHKIRQLELRLALGQGGAPKLVFSTVEGGLLSPDNLSRDWRRVCRQKHLPLVQFHALRHTHASLLIAKGVDVLAVGRRLGHSRASTTLDKYGHMVEGGDAAAAKAIEGLLK
jgi:integrase